VLDELGTHAGTTYSYVGAATIRSVALLMRQYVALAQARTLSDAELTEPAGHERARALVNPAAAFWASPPAKAAIIPAKAPSSST